MAAAPPDSAKLARSTIGALARLCYGVCIRAAVWYVPCPTASQWYKAIGGGGTQVPPPPMPSRG